MRQKHSSTEGEGLLMSSRAVHGPLWMRMLFSLLGRFPASWLGALGLLVGHLFYYLDKKHRKVTLQNIALVFPEKTERERAVLAKKAFLQNGRTLMEIPLVFTRSKDYLLSRVIVEGEHVLTSALAEEKGLFLLASHFSNWELMGLMPSMLGYTSSTIYRPLNQSSLESFTLASRARFGTKLHPRKKGLRWLFTALKQNHCVIVAIDQHMGAGNGVPVPFLGHLASTTPLPAPFVQKNGTPLVGMVLERINDSFYFKLRFWRIETPASTADATLNDIQVMTAACASFDTVIKSNPEQWLWMHHRWRPDDL